MSLRDVLCQRRAVGSLMKAVEAGRLAHAYIFAGEEGVGKFTTAREFARMLLCHNRGQPARSSKNKARKTDKKKPAGGLLFGAEPEETTVASETLAETVGQYDSCGHCQSCRLIDAGTHPDFQVVYKELLPFTKDPNNKDKKTPADLSIDVIREFLIERAVARPKLGEASVFVVREAEKTNRFSENAMLKILEEPPKHCTIVLLCTQADLLLPTIRSRCQLIRFGPVDESVIVERLAGQGVRDSEAVFWARFSQGSLGVAQAWAGTDIGEPSIYQIKREVVDRLAALRPGDVLETAERLTKAAKEIAEVWEKQSETANKSDLQRRARKGLLRMIIGVYEDALTSSVTPGRPLIHTDQSDAIARIRQGRDAETLADGIETGYEKLRWIESHVNERLIFEQYLFRLCGCDTIHVLSMD